MPAKTAGTTPYVKYHNDGTIWAKGQTKNGKPSGLWKFYRKDGSVMRSGSFTDGKQSGKWTTYRADGSVVKVTTFKPKGTAPKAKAGKGK